MQSSTQRLSSPPVHVSAAAGGKCFPQQNLVCAQGLQDADLEAKIAFYPLESLLSSVAPQAAPCQAEALPCHTRVQTSLSLVQQRPQL